MITTVSGPSHVKRIEQALKTGQIYWPNQHETEFVGDGGLPVWSFKYQNAGLSSDRTAAIVGDFRFGNNILAAEIAPEFSKISDRSFKFSTVVNKSMINDDLDRILFKLSMVALKALVGQPRNIRLFFWDLFAREARNREAGKFFAGGVYKHPVWNIHQVEKEFHDKAIALASLVSDTRVPSLYIDGSNHPSIFGYKFLAQALSGRQEPAAILDDIDTLRSDLGSLLPASDRKVFLLGDSILVRNIKKQILEKTIVIPQSWHLTEEHEASSLLQAGHTVLHSSKADTLDPKLSGVLRELGDNPHYKVILWEAFMSEVGRSRSRGLVDFPHVDGRPPYAELEEKLGASAFPLSRLTQIQAGGSIELGNKLGITQKGLFHLYQMNLKGVVNDEAESRYAKLISNHFR